MAAVFKKCLRLVDLLFIRSMRTWLTGETDADLHVLHSALLRRNDLDRRYPGSEAVISDCEVHGVSDGNVVDLAWITVLKGHGHGGHESLYITVANLQQPVIRQYAKNPAFSLEIGNIAGCSARLLRLIGAAKSCQQEEYTPQAAPHRFIRRRSSGT